MFLSPPKRAPNLRNDHYEWISGYLQARGYATPTRLLMTVVSSSLAFIAAAYGTFAYRELGFVLGASATVASVASTTMWLRTWPTRGQSLTFALAGNGPVWHPIEREGRATGRQRPRIEVA